MKYPKAWTYAFGYKTKFINISRQTINASQFATHS